MSTNAHTTRTRPRLAATLIVAGLLAAATPAVAPVTAAETPAPVTQGGGGGGGP
jgi:hypothetical protein